MTVKSMFDFKFPAAAAEEGAELAKDIGNDMPPLDGYLDHEVIQDTTDTGHVMVNTSWASQEQAQAVLKDYQQSDKIKKAQELIPGGPKGFIGQTIT